jgi:hypothetical protein
VWLENHLPFKTASRYRLGCVLGVCLVAVLGLPRECNAQDFHPFTAAIGGGASWRDGSDLRGFNVDGDVGVALTPRPERYDEYGNALRSRPWRLYITANFIFIQSSLSKSAVEQAIALNPQNPSLLSAVTGRSKGYNATLGPSLRYRVHGGFSVYALAGFGWLDRTVDFIGVPTQGTALGGNRSGKRCSICAFVPFLFMSRS